MLNIWKCAVLQNRQLKDLGYFYNLHVFIDSSKLLFLLVSVDSILYGSWDRKTLINRKKLGTPQVCKPQIN